MLLPLGEHALLFVMELGVAFQEVLVAIFQINLQEFVVFVQVLVEFGHIVFIR